MNYNTPLFFAVAGPAQRLVAPGPTHSQTTADERIMVQRKNDAPTAPRAWSGFVAGLADWFWGAFENADRQRRERFLAQATDLYDVERRMQALDRAAASPMI